MKRKYDHEFTKRVQLVRYGNEHHFILADEDFDIMFFKKYGYGHKLYEDVINFINNWEGGHSMYYMDDLTLNKMMERSEEAFKLRTNVCRTIWEYLKLDDKGDTDGIKVKYVKQAIEQALSGQKYD